MAEPLRETELAAAEGLLRVAVPRGEEPPDPAAPHERDADPRSDAEAGRNGDRTRGAPVGDDELAARHRLLQPRQVAEAEARGGEPLHLVVRDAARAGDAEAPGVLVEARRDRPREA